MSGGTPWTAGPWRTVCEDLPDDEPRKLGDTGRRFWSVSTEGKFRGTVANVHAAEHIDGITYAERDANACLIAAAPEMAGLLQMVLDRGYISSSIDEERDDHAAIAALLTKIGASQ